MRPDIEHIANNGNLININGEVIGKHRGYPFYTIGQRKGLGGGYSEPQYVVNIDANKNEVMIGNKKALEGMTFLIDSINLIGIDHINDPMEVEIKIRYNDNGHLGTLYPVNENTVKVKFRQPQRAITPGQSAVFFKGISVLGGGVIKEQLDER
jgi:tRNA-specific 2-thiouridylase